MEKLRRGTRNILKHIFTICFFLLSLSFAQSAYFTGIISDGFPIQMELEFSDTKITGSYYYESVGVTLELYGAIENANIRLEEYNQQDSVAQLTGTFSGTLSTNDTSQNEQFSGTWASAYGNAFPFILSKFADYVDISIRQGRIKTTNRYPYFVRPNHTVLNDYLQNTFIERQLNFFREGQNLLNSNDLTTGWALDSLVTLRYASADFVSMEESIYLYTDGAHGNIGLASHNFMIEEAGLRILELRDMFTARADFLTPLNQIILADLGGQGAAWVLDATVTQLSEQDLQVFTVTPLGLNFLFEPYLMGPYAQGNFEVLVSFDVIPELINETSPLFRFTNR